MNILPFVIDAGTSLEKKSWVYRLEQPEKEVPDCLVLNTGVQIDDYFNNLGLPGEAYRHKWLELIVSHHPQFSHDFHAPYSNVPNEYKVTVEGFDPHTLIPFYYTIDHVRHNLPKI